MPNEPYAHEIDKVAFVAAVQELMQRGVSGGAPLGGKGAFKIPRNPPINVARFFPRIAMDITQWI